MATYQLRAEPSRVPVIPLLLAIVAFHGLAALGIFLAARPGEPGAARSGWLAPPASAEAWADPPAQLPAPVPLAAPVQQPAPVVNAPALEVLAAPAVVQMEPVVPLPPDPEERAEVLVDVRQRRLAQMLEQRMRRASR